jgi:monofunctional biosynthetic peptidoglycan transglycosylase
MLRLLFRRLLKYSLLRGGLALLVIALRWLPLPGSALMIERKIESWRDGKPIDLEHCLKARL